MTSENSTAATPDRKPFTGCKCERSNDKCWEWTGFGCSEYDKTDNE